MPKGAVPVRELPDGRVLDQNLDLMLILIAILTAPQVMADWR